MGDSNLCEAAVRYHGNKEGHHLASSTLISSLDYLDSVISTYNVIGSFKTPHQKLYCYDIADEIYYHKPPTGQSNILVYKLKSH